MEQQQPSQRGSEEPQLLEEVVAAEGIGAVEETELVAAAREDDDDVSSHDTSDDEELLDDDSDCSSDEDEGSPLLDLPVLGQHDGGRMSLGKSERRYALQIKAAVEADPELDNLSDFMYAQLALVSLDENNLQEPSPQSLQAVLERVQGLQDLRQEYFVRDTYEDGCTLMRRAIQLLPGWFIAFSFLQEKGMYLRVSTLVKFDMSIFRDPLKVRIWLAAIYYINHCHVPDLEAVRRGFLNLIECQGYDWRNQSMLSIKAFTEMAPSIALYPILCKQAKMYNTGMFARLLASMAKRFLPKRMTEAFEFLGDEQGHLVDIFVTPTPELADERLITTLQQTLQLRYENEKSFRL